MSTDTSDYIFPVQPGITKSMTTPVSFLQAILVDPRATAGAKQSVKALLASTSFAATMRKLEAISLEMLVAKAQAITDTLAAAIMKVGGVTEETALRYSRSMLHISESAIRSK